MKRFIIFLFAALFSIQLSAQEKTFSSDKESFVKELDKFMKENKRESSKLASMRFAELVNNGKISNEMIPSVINQMNLMADRKQKAYPDFEAYMLVLEKYSQKPKSADFFVKWANALFQITEAQKSGQHKDFRKFVEFSTGLFEERAIYRSNSKTWQALSDDFEFRFENGVVSMSYPPTNLLAYTNGDSIRINSTTGVYYPMEDRWEGQGGRVNWARAGLDSTQIYAQLRSYKLDASGQELKADSVSFYLKRFMETPMLGSYENKLVPNNKMSTTAYPKFESYDKDLEIDKIGENISFVGGIKVDGAKIYGVGDENRDASMIFYMPDGKTKALRASMKEVSMLKPIDIKMNEAEVVVYLGEDSIYHPGIALTFNIPNRELKLLRGERGTKKVKFYSSYHKSEIEADQLSWDLDKELMEFKMISGAGEKPMTVESINYFSQNKYRQIQGNTTYQPLAVLRKMVLDYGTNELLDENVAKAFNPNLSVSQASPIFNQLVEEGFIRYDRERSTVEVLPKATHYVDSYIKVLDKGKGSDYDIIKFNSLSKDISAEINLQNYAMEVNGVEAVPISDSGFVVFFPDDKTLTYGKDRDMEFDGLILAGRLDLHGAGFYFHYTPFNVDLTVMDSMLINIPWGTDVDAFGDPILVPLESYIEKLTGTLEIDAPLNKSGRITKDLNYIYPIITSKEVSYIYYDRIKSFPGAYPRDSFYFALEPFKMDSLNDFLTPGLGFDGTLVSADIFEPFPERVRVQRDLTLGFETVTPATGFAAYRGKGKFTSQIKLDGNGLTGKGRVDYQSGRFWSQDIIFFPDTMMALVDTMYIAKTEDGVATPEVHSSRNTVLWEPYQDEMHIRMTDQVFAMYEDQTEFTGELLLTDKGLTGGGALDWDEAKLTSKLINFRTNELESDTASLEIKALAGAGDKVSIRTPNVYAKVDFEERFGNFKANTADIPTEFDYNQYKIAINEFDWDIDAKTLEFRAPEDSEGAPFESTREDQYGLKFLGMKAQYDLVTSIMDIEGVKEIQVADGVVIPHEGKVTIDTMAVMHTLENASIVMDTINQYHTITGATVDIFGKHNLFGTGQIGYLTKGVDTQFVELSDIKVRKETVEGKKEEQDFRYLIAEGTIPLESNFQLYENIDYEGKVNILSKDQFFNFDGFAKINYDYPPAANSSSFFSFQQSFNPGKPNIFFDSPESPSGGSVTAGINYAKRDTSGMYVTLLGQQRSGRDAVVLDAKGVVTHREADDIYIFGDTGRVLNGDMEGNLMRFNDRTGEVFAEGILDMGFNLGAMDYLAAGTVENKLGEGEFIFDVTLMLDMQMDKTVMELLGFYLFEENYNSSDIDYTKGTFEKAMYDLIEDDKEQEKFFQTLNTTGLMSRTKEFYHGMILTDLTLVFDPIAGTYRNKGKFGLAFMGEKPIHLVVDGYLEFDVSRTNTAFDIYFKTDLKDYIYFNYTGTTLSIASSFDDIRPTILAVDSQKRRVTNKDNQRSYIYNVGSNTRAKSFEERMKVLNQ